MHTRIKSKSFALTVPKTEPDEVESESAKSVDNDEYQENVESMKKLLESKNPPAQTIQMLISSNENSMDEESWDLY